MCLTVFWGMKYCGAQNPLPAFRCRSRNYDGTSLARSASRRSGGSARSRGGGGGGGGAKKKAGGGGARRSGGGGGGGGGGAKRKRSRADFEDVEFEEEVDEELELSGENWQSPRCM